MNKKSFVLLAAAMTGVSAVAVGAIAVSGANQMSKFSVGTNAAGREIVFDKTCIDPDDYMEDNGYYYFEVESKTAVTKDKFTNLFDESYFYVLSEDNFILGGDSIMTLSCPGGYQYCITLYCLFEFNCSATITDVTAEITVDGVQTGFGLDSGTSTKYTDVFERDGKQMVLLSLSNLNGEETISWDKLTIKYNY